MLQLKTVIEKLDKNNRIRHLQGLSRIHYNVLEVDRLCELYKHDDYATQLVVDIIQKQALNTKH